ncbi:unnamed protein product [Lupinus luteus]|uniref:C2H2-type domain-containing protein n=1 Tax=Lupinus luteus TaxID=3873 RepID=A0AAV1XT33_LUPLU
MLDKNNNNNNTVSSGAPSSSDAPFTLSENGVSNKRKRRPAGTPDPDAEVVSLSPKTLLESDRYVCEICNQGFQRDQNLQMHRRRHKVPWKLLKRETQGMKKKVFVCPEPSCLHHDPCHALGDLVGIKKHFRRKHSNHKQWVCDKCSKGYAVQSDYKAHIKICGTRGHSCDCGRVFSRVESFIEHQDSCNIRQHRPELQALQPACSSRTASSTSPSSEANFSIATTKLQGLRLPKSAEKVDALLTSEIHNKPCTSDHMHNLELQLLPSSTNSQEKRNSCDQNYETHLKLSIGSCSNNDKGSESDQLPSSQTHKNVNDITTIEIARLKEFANEELKLAMEEKAYAEEARREAKRLIEIAEIEFENAQRIRKQAQSELGKAEALKNQASKKMTSTVMEITCQACKQKFQTSTIVGVPSEETSIVMNSYMSSATTEG